MRAIREQLEQRALVNPESLFEELARLDPMAASKMEVTNLRRVIRALEVTLGAHRPFSSFGGDLRKYDSSATIQIGLRVPSDELDRRIETRFREWLDNGLLDEVQQLADRPDGLSRTAQQAAGYRELFQYVRGECSLEVATENAIVATRRLARRQRRWFTRDPRIEWFDTAELAEARLRGVLSQSSSFVGN